MPKILKTCTCQKNKISNRTFRYQHRTIKKLTNNDFYNTKYIKELKLALDYYIQYSFNSFYFNNNLINKYNNLLLEHYDILSNASTIQEDN